MTDKRTDLMIRQSKINNAFFGKETIMEQYEVESKINYLRNWRVPIPGTDDAVVCLGVNVNKPDTWHWSLWTGANASNLVDAGSLDFPGLNVSAFQVARVAYLLTVDYANATREQPAKIETTETTF